MSDMPASDPHLQVAGEDYPMSKTEPPQRCCMLWLFLCRNGRWRVFESTPSGYPIVVSRKCKTSTDYSGPKDTRRLNSPRNCVRQAENDQTNGKVVGQLRKHVHSNTPGNNVEKKDRIGVWPGRPATK